MAFRYTLLGAVTLAVISVAGAQAQSPFPPVGQEQHGLAFPARRRRRKFLRCGQPQRQPQPQQQQSSPCVDQYLPLREEVDKRFEATKAGIAKHGSAAESLQPADEVQPG